MSSDETVWVQVCTVCDGHGVMGYYDNALKSEGEGR